MRLSFLAVVAAAVVLSGCMGAGEMDTEGSLQSARGGSLSFAAALQDVRQYCVAHGPGFEGSAAAVRGAGGRALPDVSGKQVFLLPSGGQVMVSLGGNRPQCNYIAPATASPAEMERTLAAQPDLSVVPNAVEQVNIGGQTVAFRHLWRAPATGVVLAVSPGATELPTNRPVMTVVVQRYVEAEMRPSRNGLIAVIPMG